MKSFSVLQYSNKPHRNPPSFIFQYFSFLYISNEIKPLWNHFPFFNILISQINQLLYIMNLTNKLLAGPAGKLIKYRENPLAA